jgi:hypothetical protein
MVGSCVTLDGGVVVLAVEVLDEVAAAFVFAGAAAGVGAGSAQVIPETSDTRRLRMKRAWGNPFRRRRPVRWSG